MQSHHTADNQFFLYPWKKLNLSVYAFKDFLSALNRVSSWLGTDLAVNKILARYVASRRDVHLERLDRRNGTYHGFSGAFLVFHTGF